MASHATISLLSYPKINLALDILRQDSSGYHEIQTVFHQLSAPTDEIILEKCKDGIIEVKCDNPKIPIDKTNTVLKAALLFRKYIKARHGVRERRGARIFIKKRIPLMSGLGGGASNAVAALKGLAKLWGVEDSLLRRIADQIGMDCNFFFDGGTALGEHFGEKITPLPPLPNNIYFEVIETGVEISSHWAYQHLDIRRCGKNTEKTKKLIQAIAGRDANGILENLHNDFEEFVFEKYPELQKIKQQHEVLGKSRVILCGSGGCLYVVSAG